VIRAFLNYFLEKDLETVEEHMVRTVERVATTSVG
jgi:hypothetical protein